MSNVHIDISLGFVASSPSLNFDHFRMFIITDAVQDVSHQQKYSALVWGLMSGVIIKACPYKSLLI